jgi:hypothetical protein
MIPKPTVFSLLSETLGVCEYPPPRLYFGPRAYVIPLFENSKGVFAVIWCDALVRLLPCFKAFANPPQAKKKTESGGKGIKFLKK